MVPLESRRAAIEMLRWGSLERRVEMGKAQRELYKSMKDEMLIAVNEGLITAANAAAAAGRLTMLASGCGAPDPANVPGGDLEDEGDEADLGEGQRQVLLEIGIDRRQQRLQEVVEAVRDAERRQDRQRRADGGRALRNGASRVEGHEAPCSLAP